MAASKAAASADCLVDYSVARWADRKVMYWVVNLVDLSAKK